MIRTTFFQLHVGGYWAGDGSYNGGEVRRCRVDYERPSLAILIDMVAREGFTEDMCKFSYFPSGASQNRKDICSDDEVKEMILQSPELENVSVYVVRADDPYLDDVVIGEEEEEEEEPESDGEIDFYQDDYVENDDSDDDGDNVEFSVGQVFASQGKCREAIEKYAVIEKMNIKFRRSERKKVEAYCAEGDCQWRIYASINSSSDKMVVRSLGAHDCYPSGAVKLYSAPKIAADFLNEFRTNQSLSADQIMMRLLVKGLRITKTKCQSARQIMLHIISDEYAEQFTRMYDYVEELRKSNPGSTVILGTKNKVFEKFYTCFEAQKTGWKNACRRIIHLDGTFLKGRMKGILLTAVGRDPNNSMFIIAWALVPVENKEYWAWFIELLREDLSLELGNALAISSDQQKGLIYAIKTLLPYAEHRMCARHIYANLKKRHGGDEPMQKFFWKCARSYNKTVFDRLLEKMKDINVEAYEELKKTVNSHWSRAYFSDIVKSPAVENNISESYNGVLKEARRKPVVALLEDIRRHVMSSNVAKIKEIQNFKGLVTPKALAILEKRKKSVKWCKSLSNGRGKYEVDHGKNKYIVLLRDQVSCTCRSYDVSGIPCCHIMDAMWAEYKDTKKPETVISDWYSVEKWKLCYNSLLAPVNGMELWETHSDVVVMPPPDRIMPGRQKKNDRIRDPSEDSEKAKVTCSNCHKIGHNIRTCQEDLVPKPDKPAPEFPSYHANVKVTCGNCQQKGHNKRKCKLPPVQKPPNLPPGRPLKKLKTI